jgi:hypothetical protein
MKINIEGNLITTTADSQLHVVISGARGPQGPEGPAGDVGVPYTGATQDVDLGEFGLSTGYVEFDNTPTSVPTTDGSMSWSDTDGTVALRLKGGNVISKLGETQHLRVYNNTGVSMAKGKVVYVTGSQGQRLTVALADADTELLSKDTIGITAEAIADQGEGFIIIAGVLTNISTTGFLDGDTVFLSQTAGGYTKIPPADPAHLVILGFVVKGGSGGAGSIYVKVDNGYELEELHNVIFNGLTDKDILQYESSTQLWKNKPKNYSQVLTSGTSFEIALATIGVTVNNVKVYTPSGDEVSVPYRLSDKLYINSNVNLLNHIIKII